MRKNVVTVKAKYVRYIALMIAIVISVTCFGQIGVFAESTSTSVKVYDTAGDIICRSDDQGSSSGDISTGEHMIIRASVGFADTDGTEHSVKLYLGTMDSVFLTYFNDGGKTVGETYMKDGITYTVCVESGGEHSGEYYLDIKGYNVASGQTTTLDIRGYFDNAAPNGTEWNITLNVDGEDCDTVTIGAKSDVTMRNTKTVSDPNVILNNISGADVISNDIVYSIQAYAGNTVNTTQTELENGVAAIEKYTITDTLTLPDGMYFKVGGADEDIIKDELKNIFSVSFGNIGIQSFEKRGDKVKSVTFTYTRKNGDKSRQIEDTSGTVTVKGGSIGVSEEFTCGNINNEIQTSYKAVGLDEKQTGKVSADVNVQRPKEGDYSNISKVIEDVSDPYGQFNSYWQNNSYLIEGDYVLYKISFTNSGNTVMQNVSFEDILPDGLELVTEFDDLNQNNHFDKYPNNQITTWDSAAWGNTGGNVIDKTEGTVKIEDKSITFENITLEGGQTFYGYVIARVSAMMEDTLSRPISNKTEINGITVSADTEQRRTEPDIRISKTAVKVENDGSEANVGVYHNGDVIKYYITAENKGSGDAQNVSIRDYFPKDGITVAEHGIITSVNGGAYAGNYTEDATATGDPVYMWNNINMPAGSSVTITVTGIVKDGAAGQIVNTASAVYNDRTVTAQNVLIAASSETDPSAKVGLKKELTSNNRYINEGDLVTYRITFTTEDAFTVGDPLVIMDTFPAWLKYQSHVGSSGVTVDQTENTIMISYIGDAVTGYVDITLRAVDTTNYIGAEFINTAYVQGGTSASADPITPGAKSDTISSGGLKVEKTAYVIRDGARIDLTDEDNIVETGETVNFDIKVSNTGLEPVTKFTLYDEVDGSYAPIHSSVSAKFINSANGTINDGLWLPMVFETKWNGITSENEGYQKEVSEWRFGESNSNTGVNTVVIAPGEYIVISYSLTTAKSFSTGENAVAVDDSEYSVVSYKSLPKLSIEKTAQDQEIVCEDNHNLKEVSIDYTVTVKNESTSAYTSSGVYFVDELPNGMRLDGAGNVRIGSTMVSDVVFYTGNSYDAEEWTPVDAAGDSEGRIVGIELGSALTIPGNSEMVVTYTLRLTSAKIEELQDEIEQNESYDFTPQELVNNVYFHGDGLFRAERDDGTVVVVNTIAANNSVMLRTNAVKPYLEKTAYAYMAPNSQDIIESDSNADVGAYLIWKIKLTNLTSLSTDTMRDYVITDTLPDGYEYVEGNTYTNSAVVKYPDDLSDNNLRSGKIIKTSPQQGWTQTEQIEYEAPEITGNTLEWHFNGDNYSLDPGESIEFTFITKPDGESSTNSGIYTNHAAVTVDDIVYEVFDSVNTSASGSFALNSVKTSSLKTAETEGETVTYTLTIKNDSAVDDIKNLTLIDRLPYRGDTGVLTSDARGSECDVEYSGGMTVKIEDETLKEGTDYNVSYSGSRGVVFDETDGDWDGENDRVSWLGTCTNSTRLIRIQLSRRVSAGDVVTVTFNGTMKAEDLTKPNKVYNTFGYCYDSETNINMAAEAPKAEAVLEPSVQDNGAITVTKNYIDRSASSRIFYFAVYDGEYRNGGSKIGNVGSLTLRGAADGSAVTASMMFTGLIVPDQIGRTKTYYVYETDENGIPITQSSALGYNMNAGNTRTEEGEYCYVMVNVTMSDRIHTVSFTNEVPQPTVKVSGPYVADVPIDFASAVETNDSLESGLAVNGVIEEPVDDNNDQDRNMKDIWDNGTKTEHSNGWGGDQGHTVATGFLAEITGTGTTVNNAIWTIKTNNGDGDVYVKLPGHTKGETVAGNSVEKVEGEEDLYKITGNDPITMVLRLTLPTITLADGSKAYIGVIVDQIYDKNAEATMEVNGEITEMQKQEMNTALNAANKAPGTLVNSPDNEDSFTAEQ